MPQWAPKCLQQEPIQCPLCLPWGRGCRAPMPSPGAPGSTSAADEGHQELPRGSWSELASPQPDATARNAPTAVQAGLTAAGGGGVTPREAMGVPAGGHRGAWEARGGARGLWKGYQETRSCSGLEAARKQSHAVTGHLGSSYEVMGRAKAPAGGGSATPVRQERGSAHSEVRPEFLLHPGTRMMA